MAAKLTPFIVCSGNENFDLDLEIQKARGSKNRQVIVLDGAQVDTLEILEVCEIPTFDDDRPKLVIVDNAEQVKATEALEGYIADKDPTDLSTILLAVCRPKKAEAVQPAIWNKAASKGTSRVYTKLKPWDTKGKLARLHKEAGVLGVSLGKGVDELLLGAIGDDLYVQVNELRKLAMLAGPHGMVTTEHVLKVVAAQPPATPFEVADAACEKNSKRAMNLVAHLYRTEGEAASVPIASALMHHVQHLLMARSLLDAGKSKEDIAGALGMNPYRLQMTYLLWSNRHSVASLKTTLARLCQLDADVKGPARSKRTLVELAVLRVAS